MPPVGLACGWLLVALASAIAPVPAPGEKTPPCGAAWRCLGSAPFRACGVGAATGNCSAWATPPLTLRAGAPYSLLAIGASAGGAARGYAEWACDGAPVEHADFDGDWSLMLVATPSRDVACGVRVRLAVPSAHEVDAVVVTGDLFGEPEDMILS